VKVTSILLRSLLLILPGILIGASNSHSADQPAAAAVPKVVTTAKPLPNPAKYIPTTISLTERVSISSFSKGQPTGLHILPLGTILIVKGVNRDKIVVSYTGGTAEIPATSTDLLEQMIEEYERFRNTE
jgi:hypothetical protein